MFIKIVLKISVILGRTDTLILSLQINEHRISPFIQIFDFFSSPFCSFSCYCSYFVRFMSKYFISDTIVYDNFLKFPFPIVHGQYVEIELVLYTDLESSKLAKLTQYFLLQIMWFSYVNNYIICKYRTVLFLFFSICMYTPCLFSLQH